MPDTLMPSSTKLPPPAPTAPSGGSLPHDIAAHEKHFGDTFRRDYPAIWWLTLLGPILASGGVLAYLAVLRGTEFVVKLSATALATFFGLGRFVIILGSDAPKGELVGLDDFAKDASKFNFLTRIELFGMVTWMDVVAACLLIFHAGFIFRIPKIGPKMLLLREEGEFFMRVQPWMRRFAFIGLVVFVVIPVAATGSVGGAILGRMLGMSRTATLVAIVAGTLIGNSLMLLAGKALSKVPFFDPHHPASLAAGVGVIITIIAGLNWYYRTLKRKYKDDARFPAG